MKQANPTLNGACNWNNRVKTPWATFPKHLGPLVSFRVVSTPNGQTYGGQWHIPCNHVLHMEYARGSATFDGVQRKETLA